MPQLRETGQLALKHEAVEGTARTLAAADVIEVEDLSSAASIDRFQPNPRRTTFGARKSRSGVASRSFPFKVEVRGSGTATTRSQLFKVLETGGFRLENAVSIAIGAITSGPYTHGETVTGGTSSATARVVFDTADGAASMYLVPIAGTLQSGETLTGGTSGATCTSSGAPASLGIVARPWTPQIVKQVSIGAVSGGPFTAGERITGGTSSAEGRVLLDCENGDAALVYEVLSGTFQNAEVVTGEDSGATATSSSAPADSEFAGASATCGLREGLTTKNGKGARSTLKFVFKNGEPGYLKCEAMGASVTPSDVALLSGVTYPSTLGPVFDGMALTLGSYSPIFEGLEIDAGNRRVARRDANTSGGLKSYVITNREPTLTIDPEEVAVATHPFYTDWEGDVSRALDFTLGSSAGNRFRFHMPQVQPTEIGEGDREGIATNQLTAQINDTTDSDQDLTILAY